MRRIATVLGLLLCAGTMMAAAPQQKAPQQKATDAPANTGVQAAVDEKGQLRPATTEEMSRLAAMAFKPRTAVVPVTHASGAVSIPLDETTDHLLVVRTEADGTLEVSCTDDHQDAAKFMASSASLDTIMRVGPVKVRKAQRAEKE